MTTNLITGGAGFIGSHLSEILLEKGEKVIVLDNLSTGDFSNIAHLEGNSEFQVLIDDVSNEDLTEHLIRKSDRVFHLAASVGVRLVIERPTECLTNNILGTDIVLRYACRYRKQVLIASTSEVYGDPLEHPQRESYNGNVKTMGPRACYDEGKRCAETLFFDYWRQHKLRIKVARIFNTYGPRMHPNDGRVVSNFIMQALRGEPITIFGDGSQTRAFCYVDDLIEGFVRLMAAPDEVTGPVNLGNPSEMTVRDLAERVIRLTGSRSKLAFKPLPVNDPTQRCPDIAKARDILGWEPKVDLETGLKRTIDYFRRFA